MRGVVHSDVVTSSDGTKIAFERSGAGPVIVLVASALADRSDTKRLARHLAERFTVVSYDRRGRGQSGDNPAYAPALEVDDLEAVMAYVGTPVTLFGSSSGAVLALDAAQSLGRAVERLVLFEPPLLVDASRPPVTPASQDELRRLVAGGRRSDAVKAFMVRQLGMPRAMVAFMRLLPSWSKLTDMAPTLVYDGEIMSGLQAGTPLPQDRWTSIDSPTLVVTGGKSEPFFRSGAEALVDLLPSARHEVLAGANHSAVVAAPKRLAAVVARFMTANG
jgi:pimeloyl-ACP methyl ester carboxylesterase